MDISAVYTARRELEAAGVDEGLVGLWMSAKVDFEEASEAVKSASLSMIADMERVIRYIDAGQHINGLGELQGRGPGYDIKCALRQKAAETLNRTVHAVVRSVALEGEDTLAEVKMLLGLPRAEG